MLEFIRAVYAYMNAVTRSSEAELAVGDRQKRSATTDRHDSGSVDLALLLLTTAPYNPSLPVSVAAPHRRKAAHN